MKQAFCRGGVKGGLEVLMSEAYTIVLSSTSDSFGPSRQDMHSASRKLSLLSLLVEQALLQDLSALQVRICASRATWS